MKYYYDKVHLTYYHNNQYLIPLLLLYFRIYNIYCKYSQVRYKSGRTPTFTRNWKIGTYILYWIIVDGKN